MTIEDIWEAYSVMWFQEHGGMGVSGPTLVCMRDEMSWDQLMFHLKRRRQMKAHNAAMVRQAAATGTKTTQLGGASSP